MFNVGDIVISKNTGVEYEVLSITASGKYECKALTVSADSTILIGNVFNFNAHNLNLKPTSSNIPVLTTAAPKPKWNVGDKVFLIGPIDPKGKYGINKNMIGMLDNGLIYEINQVNTDCVQLIGCLYTWLFQYLEPVQVHTTLGKKITTPWLAGNGSINDNGIEASEPLTEEADPYGLIAQRKALRDFIGD
jgi:hypothetical protein